MRGIGPCLPAISALTLAWGLCFSVSARGEAPAEAPSAPPAQSQVPPAAAAPEVPAARPTKSAKKGRTAREKEADGSEARDRFQADTVIKSKYEIDGQPLEVDPD